MGSCMGQAKSSNMSKAGEKSGPQTHYGASAPPVQHGAPPVYSYTPSGAPPVYGGAPPPAGAPGSYQDLPPAYSTTPNNSLVGAAGNSQQQQYQQQYMAQHYGAAYTAPQLPPGSMVQGQFDAGARFSAAAPPSIPPPPPGVAPTQAQLAAMQGRNVIMGQKEGGIMNGSGSGG